MQQVASAVSVRGLTHRYHEHHASEPLLAVSGMDLSVGAGEFVALVGPSGCGKTTVMRVLAGLLDPSAGEVSVLGGAPRDACAARSIGLVAQDAGLLPWRTVAGNVVISLQLADATVDRESGTRALLERVALGAFASFYPRELSGGMRQRVALARALAHGPRLLLMDEPFGALDELSREQLCYELLRIWERERVSVLFVTHSIREAVLLSDRVVVMGRSPGHAVADVPIALPRPRTQATQDTPQFAAYVARIRGALGFMPADSP
jgi:NitT/TauT family transport system ATP-binding protein